MTSDESGSWSFAYTNAMKWWLSKNLMLLLRVTDEIDWSLLPFSCSQMAMSKLGTKILDIEKMIRTVSKVNFTRCACWYITHATCISMKAESVDDTWYFDRNYVFLLIELISFGYLIKAVVHLWHRNCWNITWHYNGQLVTWSPAPLFQFSLGF